MVIETDRLQLVLPSIEEVRQRVAQMPPEIRSQLSAAWLTLLEKAKEPDPWIHGFTIVGREGFAPIGQCGFKGPPTPEGVVEIAYAIDDSKQGNGFATEAATALAKFSLTQPAVKKVIAHTLPEPNASTRVLTKCGFRKVGEVIDPEDGKVWRWEYPASDDRVRGG